MPKGEHLNLTERIVIEQGLNNGSTKTAIAKTLGKDKSSICKEIKKHSFIKQPNLTGRNINGTYDCIYIKECGYNAFCTSKCEKQEKIKCKIKNKHGVCNSCNNKEKCHLEKVIYEAKKAQDEYEYELSDSRSGVNLTSSEAEALGDILKLGIDNGQSVGVILDNHSKEIDKCEKTIYNYINEGVFEASGIKNIDLRSKVSYKIHKKIKVKYKKREDRKYLLGRTYKDYQEYISTHPTNKVVEMDTVYNDETNGPFIQTFHFVEYDLMVGVYHTSKKALDMYQGVKYIKELLGDEFNKFVVLILTDRGSEFIMAQQMEELGVRVFYCDPMASCQKPHVETNHRLFRFICPKKANLTKLGLRSQEDVDLIFSHINSYKREQYHYKSPINLIEFYCPESKILERLKIKKIDPDNVKLTPDLIKK